MFEHALTVSIVSLVLGLQKNLSSLELKTLVIAGIFHDIGKLYFEPKQFDEEYKFSDEDYQRFHTHPIIGYVNFNRFEQEYPLVAMTILEHHERLDGSGYPRELHGDEMSQFGQIISVAELVTEIHSKDTSENAISHLKTLLKLNDQRFGNDLVGIPLQAYTNDDSYPPVITNKRVNQFLNELTILSKLINNWNVLIAQFDVHTQIYSDDSPYGVLRNRIFYLQMALTRAGYNPDDIISVAKGINDDHHGLCEGLMVTKEAIHQLSSMLNYFHMHWPDYGKQRPSQLSVAIQHWLDECEMSLSLLGHHAKSA